MGTLACNQRWFGSTWLRKMTTFQEAEGGGAEPDLRLDQRWLISLARLYNLLFSEIFLAMGFNPTYVQPKSKGANKVPLVALAFGAE